MSLDNGGPLDRMLTQWRAAYDKMTPEQRAAADRESAVGFVLGNLNLSTNHRTTRATVEAAYDRLHPRAKDLIGAVATLDEATDRIGKIVAAEAELAAALDTLVVDPEDLAP